MKDQLPSPDPDSSHYVRPTQQWICGKAAEGQSCRIGPDCHGNCRAVSECAPVLEVKPGDAKGRYKCTRPPEYGGPCENGPLPNGSCGRPITRCQPIRSLRNRRKVVTSFITMLTVALLLVAMGGEKRWNFISPGKISSQHSGSGFSEAFAWMHSGEAATDSSCAACHVSARAKSAGWVVTALESNPGPLHRHTLALMTVSDMTSIDENCERCHTGHTFHEPNVVQDHSCSACHREHMGSGLMKAPADSNCEICHGNASIMEASAAKGATLSPALFNFRPDNGRNVFHAPRPKEGYTKVIHSFATDHPEFQIIADRLQDPDSLKFNHQKHLTSPTIPLVNGHKLECVDCHKLDSAGHYRQSITFEQNCRQCHSLQFDTHNPDLAVPHGDSAFVRDFLRSLPVQYAEYGLHKRGIVAKADLDDFVQQQMKQIRDDEISGEDLEQKVFFGDSKQQRAQFPACTYCHEVKPNGDGAPIVTKPVIMDRWMVRGSFDHSKHLTVECMKCHEVLHSTQTSDVLLPSKATCVECHSPKGGVANGCSTCHSYHAPSNGTQVQVKAMPGDHATSGMIRLAEQK
ncbi:MAG TPA: hypothetical protein VH413_09790 [Verrucomicrobiae bacterium]|nr:hypothetical protein [Verrucomicrobiae bacterium]